MTSTPSNNAQTLRATQLTKRYNDRTVVDNVSIEVPPGEIVGLLGPNGAGKTTTFKLILGLEKADAGQVVLGESLGTLPLHLRARMGLGYLPQTPSVFTGLSVRDNLRAILTALKDKRSLKRTDSLLHQFGIENVATQKASTLSGGERRKLEFARALCSNPTTLLVDEPFAAVDPIAAEELATVIKNLANDGIGILLTDHSVRQSLSVCDRVYLIVGGKIIESGNSETIRQSANARALYLGSDV